jgi:hypothetical protein
MDISATLNEIKNPPIRNNENIHLKRIEYYLFPKS